MKWFHLELLGTHKFQHLGNQLLSRLLLKIRKVSSLDHQLGKELELLQLASGAFSEVNSL